MPTARELLEQADALMRRNRQEAAHGARESAMQDPRRVAPDLVVAPVPPPVATTLPAAPVHAKVEAPPVVVRSDEDNIPVLNEVVAPPALRASDDDVPVLTDAVDEIDVAAPDVDEGEPSDWLTPPAEDESVLGPAPPSIAVVPPATLPSTPKPHREAPPHARTPDIEDLSQRVYADHDADVTVRGAAVDLLHVVSRRRRDHRRRCERVPRACRQGSWFWRRVMRSSWRSSTRGFGRFTGC